MKKLLLTTAAIALLAASPAVAATTCAIGGQAGLSVSSLDVEAGGIPIADLSAQGLSGGVIGNCDYQFPNSPFSLGVFADYTWHQGDFELLGFEVFDVGSQWSVGGRVGYRIVEPVMVYGLAAYTELELDGKSGIDVDPDFGGWSFGGGVEIGKSDGVIIGAEYRYSQYKSEIEDFANLDPAVHTVMVTAKYSFSLGLDAVQADLN